MSIEVSNSVWLHSKATGRTKLTLLAIADHQGEQGAWPSISTLAKMTNSSERSVKRDIQELQSMGELTVQAQQAPMSGQYKTNLYWVTLPDIEFKSGVTDRHPSGSGVTNQVSRGDKSGKSGVTGSGTQNLNRNLKKHGEPYSPSDDFQKELELKFPGVNIQKNVESFNDWAEAKGATYKNWDAAFRNWIRKDYTWNPPSNASLDKERDWTAAYLREQERVAQSAVPPPKCEHGNTIALCRECMRNQDANL